MESASVSRSSATARRPFAEPIIVSWTSSASRCLSNAVTSAFPGRFRGPDLDPAREAPRGMRDQIGDDLGDVRRRELPLVVAVRSAAELSAHRAWQYAGHTNAIMPHFLHQGFAERVETGLRRAIGRRLRKWIRARQAADVDDPAAAARPHVRQRGAATQENTGEINVDHLVPLVDR